MSLEIEEEFDNLLKSSLKNDRRRNAVMAIPAKGTPFVGIQLTDRFCRFSKTTSAICQIVFLGASSRSALYLLKPTSTECRSLHSTVRRIEEEYGGRNRRKSIGAAEDDFGK